MNESIVEGVVLEHPDELSIMIRYFPSVDYAKGYLHGAGVFADWYGELLSTVDPHGFVADWPDDEDSITSKAFAIKQIENAKKELTNG